jgi:molecular chaperone DnaK
MKRSTIDFGIDLGTTTSCIAVLEGITSRIIKLSERRDFIPSMVSYNKKGRMLVGYDAKNQLISYDETEGNDVCFDFKLAMGNPGPYKTYKVNNKAMKPEELSAEILKELKKYVQLELSEEVTAAAIGIPAVFESPKRAATDRAAKLAGLSPSPLIQEPVAAALTYGFQTAEDNTFWMVYDFGGGTFDAAIMQIRDEQIQVVNHAGDNYLGGGLIDWEIIRKLLIPDIEKEYKLSKDNPLWERTISRILKSYTENAKIRLSTEKETLLEIDKLWVDNNNDTSFERVIKRSEIEPLMEPFIAKSIEICKKALKDARLSPSDIQKLILVGGPTLTPMFKELLTDGLGIPLEFKEDPITVVARGAAIFAGTQLVSKTVSKKIPILVPGQFFVELDYQPIGDDAEPIIAGKVSTDKEQNLSGYYIEFISSTGDWRSGKMELNDNGGFVGNVFAKRNIKNEYLIELTDKNGRLENITPNSFNYTMGITVSTQTLVNNVGVALANGEVENIFEKGTSLPNKGRIDLCTTKTVKRGDSGSYLIIPVVEGENRLADRNHPVGHLKVTGQDQKISRDVTAGSTVEFSLNIDESGLYHVTAYIPLLDEYFNNTFNPIYPETDPQLINNLAKQTEERFNRISEAAEKIESVTALEKLEKIKATKMVEEINSSLNQNQIQDKNAPNRKNYRRIELDAKLDEVEKIIEWPALVNEAEENIREGKKIIEAYGSDEDKMAFNRLEKETTKAINSEDTDILRQKVRALSQLILEVLMEQPGFWMAQFELLIEEHQDEMRDKQQATQFISQGYHAIDNNNIDELRDAVLQLYELLPESVVEEVRGYMSTVMNKRTFN